MRLSVGLASLACLTAVLALTLDELALHRRIRAIRARSNTIITRRAAPPDGFTRILASSYNVVRRAARRSSDADQIRSVPC